MAELDLEALKRQANGLADVLNVEERAEVAHLLIEAHKGFVTAIAALERAERLETALRRIGSLGPEATRFAITSIAVAALAPTSEDSDG